MSEREKKTDRGGSGRGTVSSTYANACIVILYIVISNGTGALEGRSFGFFHPVDPLRELVDRDSPARSEKRSEQQTAHRLARTILSIATDHHARSLSIPSDGSRSRFFRFVCSSLSTHDNRFVSHEFSDRFTFPDNRRVRFPANNSLNSSASVTIDCTPKNDRGGRRLLTVIAFTTDRCFCIRYPYAGRVHETTVSMTVKLSASRRKCERFSCVVDIIKRSRYNRYSALRSIALRTIEKN